MASDYEYTPKRVRPWSQKPMPEMLGTGQAKKAAEAIKKKRAKMKKWLEENT